MTKNVSSCSNTTHDAAEDQDTEDAATARLVRQLSAENDLLASDAAFAQEIANGADAAHLAVPRFAHSAGDDSGDSHGAEADVENITYNSGGP